MPFFLASLALALTFGATLGMVNLARLTGTWGALQRPSVWAHGYVQGFGFVGLFVMGFAYHAIPRFAGVPLAYPRTVWWTFGLQVGGITSIVAGLVFDAGGARPYWILGAAALFGAALLFAGGMVGTLWTPHPRREPFEPWVSAGALWFVAAAALGLLAALQDDVVWHHLLWPAVLLGGAGSWILGVGRRVFPASLGWCPQPALDRAAFVAYQVGVVTHVVGAWPSLTLAPARGVAAAVLPLAVLLVARGVGLRVGPGSPVLHDEGYGRHVRAAWLWLAVAVGGGSLATLDALRGDSFVAHATADCLRHTLAVGFVTQMIAGVACRFVPVFAGTTLWSPRAHAAAFWLLNASVVARLPEGLIGQGYAASAWPLLGLAGPPATMAVALFAANMAMTLRRRARRRFTRSSAAYRTLAALMDVPEQRAVLGATRLATVVRMPLLGPLLARVLTLENACWLARVSVDGVVDHMSRAERGARRAAGSGGLS